MMDKLYRFCCVNYPSVHLSKLFELDTWMGIICLLEMMLRRHRFKKRHHCPHKLVWEFSVCSKV